MGGADLGELSIGLDPHVSGQPREAAVELEPLLHEGAPFLKKLGFVTDFTERGHLRTDDALGAPVRFTLDPSDCRREMPQTAQDGRNRERHPLDDLGNRLASTNPGDRQVGGTFQAMRFGVDVVGCIHAASL